MGNVIRPLTITAGTVAGSDTLPLSGNGRLVIAQCGLAAKSSGNGSCLLWFGLQHSLDGCVWRNFTSIIPLSDIGTYCVASYNNHPRVRVIHYITNDGDSLGPPPYATYSLDWDERTELPFGVVIPTIVWLDRPVIEGSPGSYLAVGSPNADVSGQAYCLDSSGAVLDSIDVSGTSSSSGEFSASVTPPAGTRSIVLRLAVAGLQCAESVEVLGVD